MTYDALPGIEQGTRTPVELRTVQPGAIGDQSGFNRDMTFRQEVRRTTALVHWICLDPRGPWIVALKSSQSCMMRMSSAKYRNG